ncbi:hypothetical protein AG1IA_07404 [Rhizoctonia solani AG-1 IA]|uniref:Uncharacterized protein n=1 Tax=Thanatephorus cucumeris (strain AG1-IA) TaxID=983506 RepID=L8WK33_THACA|nr:hypothetical protein AG1IA_07404 [Rhizoctonia solani AG-1 IA]
MDRQKSNLSTHSFLCFFITDGSYYVGSTLIRKFFRSDDRWLRGLWVIQLLDPLIAQMGMEAAIRERVDCILNSIDSQTLIYLAQIRFG